MPGYDTKLFEPPAPLAQVSLRNPQNDDTKSDIPMLLDTGADVTLIPLTPVEQLGLTADTTETYELIGFDGRTTTASAVHLEMRFLNKTFRGRFLLINQEWGILGRDILNLIPLFFDGPNLYWDGHRRN